MASVCVLSPIPMPLMLLSADREALWRRVEAASFLTNDEKRQAVGYGRLTQEDGALAPGGS
jgi:phage portal protein BeeE